MEMVTLVPGQGRCVEEERGPIWHGRNTSPGVGCQAGRSWPEPQAVSVCSPGGRGDGWLLTPDAPGLTFDKASSNPRLPGSVPACDIMLSPVSSMNGRTQPPPLLPPRRKKQLSAVPGPVHTPSSHPRWLQPPQPSKDGSQERTLCNLMLACLSPGF